jgi:predicted nucleic acid-binding protein
VSFAVMERLNIQDVIAFDDHFRQYGQHTIL